MLVNIIQNTISSFISAGVAAAEVITTNLKMWLGFETSETLGREEVVNGDFSDGTNDWDKSTASSATISVNASDQLVLASDAGDTLGAYSSISLIEGQTYILSIDFISSNQLGRIEIGTSTSIGSTSPDDIFNAGGSGVPLGTNTYTFTASATQATRNYLYIGGRDDVNSLVIDNVSLKELTQITPDKSSNNNVGELFTGKALEFDGATEYVNTTGFEMAGTSATFAFCIYPKDTTYQFIMDLDGTVRTILGLFNGGSGQVFAFFNSGFKQFGTPIQNQWQRVVFRVNATTVECYVDGVKSGSTLALVSSIDLSTVGNSIIGGRFDTTNAANRFDGSLSDFQIYNAYWSTDDIAFDYANPNILVTDSTNTGTSIAVTNLKAYWAMSEGDGLLAYDSSGEGNNGTINGADYLDAQPRIPQLGMQNWAKSTPVADEITLIPNPTIPSQDILGNAVRDRLNSFNLDGSGYAEVADDTDLDIGTGAFTMECWVKADFENTGSSQNIIFSLGGEYNDADSASIVTSSTQFSCRLSTRNLVADNNYTIGDWYHVCVTRDGSNLCILYIDAVAQADTETTSASITNTSTNLIGRDTLTTRFYKNLISDVRLYKGKALSATEVENNYNAGLSAHRN